MGGESREYTVWFIVKPAEDMPGCWVGHCLEFDVVTQGNSPKHAFDMVREAVSMVVKDDLNAGRDPLDRRAPKEYWQELQAIVDSPSCNKQVDAFAPGQRFDALAFNLSLRVQQRPVRHESVEPERPILSFGAPAPPDPAPLAAHG